MQTTITDLRGILDALAENITDGASWSAMADWFTDRGEIGRGLLARMSDTSSRAFILCVACSVIATTEKGRKACERVELYSEYSEPGYSNPLSGVIALGDWCVIDETRDGTRYSVDRTPHNLSILLSKLGVEAEWFDVWAPCLQCGGLVRIALLGDMAPTWIEGEGGPVCAMCTHGVENSDG